MSHLPSLQSLRAFEAAYRRQNYSRAADELGLTHGAVSHRIRELEERMGARLFERSRGRMVPTADARRLLARIGPALRILEETFAAAPGARDRVVTLSVLPAFAARWLIPRLEAFRDAHPDLTLQIRAETELMREGEAALAAVRYGSGTWPGLQAEMLAGETLFPVCSPAYRDRLAIAAPADLARCRLLRHAWQPWEPWLQAAGLATELAPLGPVYEDTDLLLKAAEAGEGVALARGLLAEADLAAGRLMRLFDIACADSFAYWFVWDPRSACQPAIETVRLWLKAKLAEPPGRTAPVSVAPTGI